MSMILLQSLMLPLLSNVYHKVSLSDLNSSGASPRRPGISKIIEPSEDSSHRAQQPPSEARPPEESASAPLPAPPLKALNGQELSEAQIPLSQAGQKPYSPLEALKARLSHLLSPLSIRGDSDLIKKSSEMAKVIQEYVERTSRPLFTLSEKNLIASILKDPRVIQSAYRSALILGTGAIGYSLSRVISHWYPDASTAVLQTSQKALGLTVDLLGLLVRQAAEWGECYGKKCGAWLGGWAGDYIGRKLFNESWAGSWARPLLGYGIGVPLQFIGGVGGAGIASTFAAVAPFYGVSTLMEYALPRLGRGLKNSFLKMWNYYPLPAPRP